MMLALVLPTSTTTQSATRCATNQPVAAQLAAATLSGYNSAISRLQLCIAVQNMNR